MDGIRRVSEFRENGQIWNRQEPKGESVREAFDPERKKNLYDATMDLMLVEQTEKVPGLRAIHTRLLFQIRAIKASGAKPGAIRVAVNKLTKVIGKVKAKIKNLRKEELLEEKRRRAAEEKRKTKEEAVRRELEIRKKIRKAKERNDIEESKMGLGANYGGPYEEYASEMAAAMYSGTGEILSDMDAGTGAVVDMAVADVGAVEAAAVDICV